MFYKIKQKSAEEFLHIYITDTLKCISKNTATFKGSSYMDKRYYDFIKPQDTKQEDKPQKTQDEVIAEITARMGLKLAKQQKGV